MLNFFKSAGGAKREPITKLPELLAQKPNAVLIDVRNPDEFRNERIKGSVNIPLSSIVVAAPKKIPNSDTPLLVHCLSGARSRTACEQLARLGYTDVTDLGGIMNWPNETISG